AVRKLAFLDYHRDQPTATLSRLSLGPADIVHGPGELFLEYQLYAQSLRPNGFVAFAAYGEGLGYIPTAAAYPQGGYEVGPSATHLAPEAEAAIQAGLRDLFID